MIGRVSDSPNSDPKNTNHCECIAIWKRKRTCGCPINPTKINCKAIDQLKIAKLSLGPQDGIDDLNLNQSHITINSETYLVTGVDGSNDFYDVLSPDKNLTASDVIVFNGTVYDPDIHRQYSHRSTSPTMKFLCTTG